MTEQGGIDHRLSQTASPPSLIWFLSHSLCSVLPMLTEQLGAKITQLNHSSESLIVQRHSKCRSVDLDWSL